MWVSRRRRHRRHWAVHRDCVRPSNTALVEHGNACASCLRAPGNPRANATIPKRLLWTRSRRSPPAASAIPRSGPSGRGVNSGSLERALSVARRIRTGTIAVNGGQWFGPDSPFGGYKESGQGREHGVAGFEEYLETKTVGIPAT